MKRVSSQLAYNWTLDNSNDQQNHDADFDFNYNY